MKKTKEIFALFFANRSGFPDSLIVSARNELMEAVTSQGFGYLVPPEGMTKLDAVSSREEGIAYAKWLSENENKIDGIIICMPNFGDENGAAAAMENTKKPILIQAYPDEKGKMDNAHRRDSFCGKISIMNVFRQKSIKFTIFEPHVVKPLSDLFLQNIRDFAAVCRVVNGLKKVRIGQIGARTTPFKTVRYDEITLEKHGISVETYDLLELYRNVNKIKPDDCRLAEKRDKFLQYTDCSCVPEEKLDKICAVSIVIDELILRDDLDAIAIRCWNEMQTEFGISPCLILSELSDQFIEGVCETDVCNVLSMRMLRLVAQKPSMCLDWNNNYGNETDKCILFHCGPVAQTLLSNKGFVTDHSILVNSLGTGCGWGCVQGRIAPCSMTFSSVKTEDGRICLYFGEGKFTNDVIEPEYFGCAGTAEICNLQKILISIGKNGYKHHMTAVPGNYKTILVEAVTNYLKYDVLDL